MIAGRFTLADQCGADGVGDLADDAPVRVAVFDGVGFTQGIGLAGDAMEGVVGVVRFETGRIGDRHQVAEGVVAVSDGAARQVGGRLDAFRGVPGEGQGLTADGVCHPDQPTFAVVLHGPAVAVIIRLGEQLSFGVEGAGEGVEFFQFEPCCGFFQCQAAGGVGEEVAGVVLLEGEIAPVGIDEGIAVCDPDGEGGRPAVAEGSDGRFSEHRPGDVGHDPVGAIGPP